MSEHEYQNLISCILCGEINVNNLPKHEFYLLFEQAKERQLIDEYREICEEKDYFEGKVNELKAQIAKDNARWYSNGQKLIKLRNAAAVGRIEKYTKASLKAKLDEFDKLLEGL